MSLGSTVTSRASKGAESEPAGAGFVGPWLQSSNIWQKGTSREGLAVPLRGMSTIVRKSYYHHQCTLLGELIKATATRYFYRRRVGDKLAFVNKRSPLIHIVPCKSCPDWSLRDTGPS